MLVRTSAEFGGFIRAQRIRLGITQEELANRIGRTRRWLYDVEIGASSPALSAVIDLSKALGFELKLEEPRPSADLDSVFQGL